MSDLGLSCWGPILYPMVALRTLFALIFQPPEPASSAAKMPDCRQGNQNKLWRWKVLDTTTVGALIRHPSNPLTHSNVPEMRRQSGSGERLLSSDWPRPRHHRSCQAHMRIPKWENARVNHLPADHQHKLLLLLLLLQMAAVYLKCCQQVQGLVNLTQQTLAPQGDVGRCCSPREHLRELMSDPTWLVPRHLSWHRGPRGWPLSM